MLFSVLFDFRPGVTLGFAIALLGSIAKPLVGVTPMVLGAAVSGTAAFVLRRQRQKGAVPPHNVAAAEPAGTL
jgi:hypothetical protein